jgi:citrate synthase
VVTYLSAADAARRLGVKPATLYAYVSRGTLRRERSSDGRTSLFDADEIEKLARRGRPRRPAGAIDLTVESRLTRITPGGPLYRGHDALELARTRSFEDVAELLWTGALPKQETPAWRAPEAALTVGRAAQAALPDGILPLERLQVIVPAMAVTDPMRLHLEHSAVIAAGRAIIAGMIDCLPDQGGGSAGGDAPVAERLWSRLCARRPSRGLLRAMSAALVLLADHELAVSTLAARTAASARAAPYAVVSAGLGAVSGTRHGGASLGVEALLAVADGPADAPRVVSDVLRRGEKIPGFGHMVYRTEDPRGRLLLELVRRAAPGSRKVAVADAVIAEAGRGGLPAPNIDMALGALASAAGLSRGAGEAIFAVARTAGWIAHALEAYEADALLRPRAAYTGRSDRLQ